MSAIVFSSRVKKSNFLNSHSPFVASCTGPIHSIAKKTKQKKLRLSVIGGGLIIGVTEENANKFRVSLNVNPYI